MQEVPSRASGNITIRQLPGDSAPLGVINTAVTRGGKEVHSRGGGGDRSARTNPHQNKNEIQEKKLEGENRLGQGPKSPHGEPFTMVLNPDPS